MLSGIVPRGSSSAPASGKTAITSAGVGGLRVDRIPRAQEKSSDDSACARRRSPRRSGPRPRRTARAACAPPPRSSCGCAGRFPAAGRSPRAVALAVQGDREIEAGLMVVRIRLRRRLAARPATTPTSPARQARARRARWRRRDRCASASAPARESARLLRFAAARQSSGPARRARDIVRVLRSTCEEIGGAGGIALGQRLSAPSSTSLSPPPARPVTTLDEGLHLALGQRADEAVDRLAVDEGDDRRDRLDAELAGDRGMVVDVHLDEAHLALRGRHRLLEDRRQLLAGAAPRRPEIDQDRDAARGLDHVGAEVLGRRVLDEIVAAGGARLSALTSMGIRSWLLAGFWSGYVGGFHAESNGARARHPSRPPRRGRMRGGWPDAGGRQEIRARRCVVVAVFSSGWKFSGSWRISPASSTTATRQARSLMAPKGVTAPGTTPSVSSRSSGLPKERRPRRRSADAAFFRSIAASSRATTRKSASFLSLRNRFLVWRARDLAAQRPTLLDGEERRMRRRSWSRCRAGRGRRTARRGWRACAVRVVAEP